MIDKEKYDFIDHVVHLALVEEDRLLNEHGGKYSRLKEDGIDSNEYYRIIIERVINILKKNNRYMQEEPVSEGLEEATKEQRDLLFAKMREAGYEWDKEKLGLKKVEQELTEFEKIVEEIADTSILNAYGVKELAKRLLSNAKKQLQEEFDKQLEKAYKNADKVQYKRGYRKAIEDARNWLAWYTGDREVTLASFDAEMELKLKELSQG